MMGLLRSIKEAAAHRASRVVRGLHSTTTRLMISTMTATMTATMMMSKATTVRITQEVGFGT